MHPQNLKTTTLIAKGKTETNSFELMLLQKLQSLKGGEVNSGSVLT